MTETEKKIEDRAVAVEKAAAPKTWQASWSRKSYKREAAIIMGIFWMVITTKMFFGMTVELISALTAVYGTVTTMVTLIIMGAFGVDAYAKQIKPEKPAEG